MALTLCGLAARCAGIERVVMTEHDTFQLDEQPKYQRRAARCCRYASSITGVHSGITEYFHNRMRVPAGRLRVVPNGVPTFTPDAETRHRMRAALGVDDSTFVCLYVGRLEAVKGLHTLLNAVARLTESARRAMRVFLAGNGSERAALESLCRSQNLGETVTFLGERSDVPELLNMADAFVMTSRTEGLPMALIEAMAAGLPCIATAVGGIPAVLADDAGILVPPENPDVVAEALTRLAGDNLLRQRLAERALRKVQAQYGLEPVVSAYLELLGLPAHWPPEQ
jgi:glycosyltransferase involved in cell wall biosynthesis